MELAWNIILVSLAVIFVAFTFVIVVGAPFLPTLKDRVPDIQKLCRLKPGQSVLELGSGDGRILLSFARQGIRSVGYEINPFLVIYSKIITFKYRKLVKIHWGNYWTKQWPPTDAIFVFLLQPYMQKLDKHIIQKYPKGVKLVSFAFTIPDRKPTRQINGMYLYEYDKQLKKNHR